MIDFKQHWKRDWTSLGRTGDAALLDRLLASYAQPQRHNHTLQHLAECLDLFDQVAHLTQRPGEAALALWFHDAVYVPQAADNEARSATWAAEALLAAGADQDVIARIQALIMATAHHQAEEESDARLVIDVDLAILGAEPARFAEYEEQVRAEYASVPDELYRQKRGELLARFLQRPAIYRTAELHARLEGRARMNLCQTVRTRSQA
ncbi:N-methyl-D-aspartate receptor NMDAR2C subunit [Massilia sp. Mn16-1_5]|uniref:HD domain-containing protein n=1 Tax=Massilia sp. Mn16-1_5 TaxID=2079199 RepID=UPI00109E779F|nr:N-methyl-D-aspartate receptor NMDAR2C subunit [Massilia sp. Mn16-1_5]THC42953.1 N-methyl-D-aspartate receptor NMDAR2C subunit [Massilia sp. Mn16-1_5]